MAQTKHHTVIFGCSVTFSIQALSLVPFTINDPVPSNARRSIPTYYAEEIQDNEASSRFAGMASNSVQSVFNGNANEANEV